MIHVRCALGHETTRPSHEDLEAGPTCSALIAGGWCGAHSWQDPATVDPGDIVAVLDDRRVTRGIVDSWNRDPDRQALIVDEFGVTHHRLTWYTPGQAGPFGPVLLDHAEAVAMRPILRAMLVAARLERQEARKLANEAESARVVPQKEKPTKRGRLHETDVPSNLYDKTQDCHESAALAGYLSGMKAFTDYMADMEVTHPAYARILILNLHEYRQPVEIAKLLNITPGNARVRLHRGKEKLRKRIRATEAARSGS